MGTDDGNARRLILARRARFIAATIAGIGAVASACEPMVCLDVVDPDASAPGTGGDGGKGDSGDAAPQPCLDPLPPDAGGDAEPQPCLSPLPPDAGDAGDGG